MIRMIREDELDAVLDYLRNDLQMCLYAYIDIKKYGAANPNLRVYIDTPVQVQHAGMENIQCVIVKYYQGLQIYTADSEYRVDELIKFLETTDYNMINGSGTLISLIESTEYARQNFECEAGYVMELGNLYWEEDYQLTGNIRDAADNQYSEISYLICSDPGLGGHYKPQDLAGQLLERKNAEFGRNKILMLNGEIACHAATYAEVPEAAVVSGVITRENHRGKGYAYQVVGSLCRELLREGKRVFLFYYTETAGKLYKRLGFQNERVWKKLMRKR